jgi:hypothetical protein
VFGLTCVDGLLAYEVISFQVSFLYLHGYGYGKDIVIQLEYIVLLVC